MPIVELEDPTHVDIGDMSRHPAGYSSYIKSLFRLKEFRARAIVAAVPAQSWDPRSMSNAIRSGRLVKQNGSVWVCTDLGALTDGTEK